ncbi:MAG: DivIVA domain-containing protein [Dermatophilaceae bacterium]
MWLALVVAVVLVALTVAGIMGRIDGSLGPPTTTSSYVPLPEDRLTPADLEGVRLDTAFRGYRMDQVDEVIGRLGEEIRRLTVRLEGDLASPDGDHGQRGPGSPTEHPAGVGFTDPDSDPD